MAKLEAKLDKQKYLLQKQVEDRRNFIVRNIEILRLKLKEKASCTNVGAKGFCG